MADIPLTDNRIKSMFNSFSDLIQGNRHNHKAVRLIDELMVDIMGGLIPGVLFNFSLIVCLALPVYIYEKIKRPSGVSEDFINNHFMISGASSAFGGWFWFAAFLTFLILSYIAGHIFYRSDINIADSKDINKRKEKNKKFLQDQLPATKHVGETIAEVVQKLLVSELNVLNTDKTIIDELKKDNNQDSKRLGVLLEFINNAIIKINESAQKDIFDHKGKIFNFDVSKSILYYTLLVLFPQSEFDKGIPDNIIIPKDYLNIIKRLSLNERSILKSYRIVAREIIGEDFDYHRYIDEYDHTIELNTITSFDKFKEYVELLIACYLIITLQNDSGCTDIERLSDYPYLEYYKYLLKRNETDLVRYVDWSPAGARTKNKINRMKMEIQLDYPDAYVILNKNESHIRMAASSWHVSGFISQFAIVCFIGIIGIAIIYLFPYLSTIKFEDLVSYSTCSKFANHINKVLIIIPPVFMLALMKLMRGRIEDFIHYQRLREIFFTLYIYHKLEQRKQEAKDKDLRFENTLESSISKAICDCADRIFPRNEDMHWRFVE